MTLEQIAQVANTILNEQNAKIFANLKPQIEAWLSSQKFAMGGGREFSRLYPPLLDPDSINYATSDPALCWELSIPLPDTFDFIVFGSHAASLHSAVPAFMSICGAYGINLSRRKVETNKGLDGIQTNTNRQNYIDMYKALLEVNKIKVELGFSKCYLQLSDFLLSADAPKLYALIPAKDALLVTRDPISALKALCYVQSKAQYMLLGGEIFEAGVNFSLDTKAYLERTLKYMNYPNDNKKPTLSNDKSVFGDTPLLNENKLNTWLLDREQSFHDAQVFTLLKERIKRLKIKLTSEFVNASATMKELSEFFGLDFKDSTLYNKRVSDLKYFTPLKIYANASMPLFCNINEPLSNDTDMDASKRMRISARQAKESCVLLLDTHFGKRAFISAKKGAIYSGEISEYFEGLGDDFCVFVENPALRQNILNDEKLMKKAQFYTPKACQAIAQKAQDEKSKHMSEKDILDFLAQHKDTMELCYFVLRTHLAFLRAYKSEFIDNFTYFNQFLALFDDIPKQSTLYQKEFKKMKKIGLEHLLD